MDAKMKAIISHLFGIGWVIALILNMNNKEEYASYYIRQNLGIIIIGFALGFINVIPILGQIIWLIGSIILFVFWLMSSYMVNSGRNQTHSMGWHLVSGLV